MTSRVKAVQTGDCLILNTNNEDRQVFLAYVQVPRTTEPYGFQAREYLRKFALNKPVRYRALYEVNGREHGDAASPVFESLVEHMVSAGWAKVRGDAAARAGFTPQLAERLKTAEADAQTHHRGIWSERSPAPVVSLLTDVPSDVYGSGRKVPALVEKVQNGDRVILRAMFTETEHYVGPAFLGGIRVRIDATGGAGGSGVGAAQLAATRAVESRLLQREIRAIFHAPHPNAGHPLVTLVHPQGDIAQLLVSQGLAEVQPQQVMIGSENLLALRNAQQEAVARGAGIWRAAAQQKSAASSKFAHLKREGIVTKVVSADTFVVDGGDSVRLSSVRAPRRAENEEAAQEAREFARKLLIGQKVKISVDGGDSGISGGALPSSVKSGSAGAAGTAAGTAAAEEPRVTLSFGPSFSKNAGLEIIKAGWATALRHRRDDLARSPFYDEFVAAEEKAEQQHVGMFRIKKKTAGTQQPRAVQDASESVVRARAYLPALQRRGTFPAVVEFVISAGRLRLSVPTENCTIVVVMDGARAPAAGMPFSAEALAFVAREWNQRDVTCSVRSVDKTGAFVSSVSMGRRNLAVELVSRGLAELVGSATPELEEAEDDAMDRRVGVWSVKKIDGDDEDDDLEAANAASGRAVSPAAHPPAAAAAASPSAPGAGAGAGAGAAAAAEPTYQDATIAHVTPSELFVRLAPQDAKHKQLQAGLREFFTAATNTSARSFKTRPQRRTPVVDAATYERGVVASVRATTCEVDFVDTGAREFREVSELLPLPPQFAISTESKAPALAQPLTLQFVHRPVKFYEQAYTKYIAKYVGKPVVVYGRTVLLADSKSVTDSLNFRLVAAGLASVPVADAAEEAAQPALRAQQTAIAQRLGMWEYGDPREDEDM